MPQALLDGSPKIARLFPGYERVERDYYRRTGIFPPMHIVAIRRERATRPGLARAVYHAFSQAKDLTQRKYREDAAKQHMSLITPWFSELFEQNRRLLGEDWWPYGVSANRKAVDTYLPSTTSKACRSGDSPVRTSSFPKCSTPEVGLLAGALHAVTRVKSPAPPLIAIVGLTGMLITATR